MRRVPTVALLDLGHQRSTASHALAAQIEAALPEIVVHLRRIPSGGDPARRETWGAALRPQLARWAEAIHRLAPRVVGIGCTLWNVTAALELCDWIKRLEPRTVVVVGGPEVAARREEILSRGGIHHVVDGQAAPSMVSLLEDLGRRRGSSRGSPPRRPSRGTRRGEQSPAAIYERRIEDDLWAPGEGPILVEPDWGAGLPLWLQSQLSLPGPSLTVEGAAARLLPLLRAGLPAHLMDPVLTGDRTKLVDLLERMTGTWLGPLEIEVSARHLDTDLARRVAAAAVRLVEVDLFPLASGEVDPRPLRKATQVLSEHAIACRGVLLYGSPSMNDAGLRRAVDLAVAAGVEDLRIEPLVVPPGSRLRAEQEASGVVFAATPPYEVIGHRLAPLDDLLRSARLAAAFEYLRGALVGTGLLRAFHDTVGSAAEVLEGFSDSLAAAGKDLLERFPCDSPERLFVEYLKRHHRIDLDFQPGQVRLCRSPLLFLRWGADGRRTVGDETTGRVAQVGKHAISVLDRFDDARTGHEVCEQLVAEAPLSKRAGLRQELRRITDKLTSMSFLVPAGESLPGPGEETEGPFTCLEEFEYHYRMLSDSTRVHAYRHAIEQVVERDHHVVEIGTGTGILAVLAAQAGARVTAIERFSILGLARAMARQNGVEDRIHFVRGRSDLVEIDEPGDVLVSEIVGNRILNEGLLEATLDARRRLLRPNARLIPRQIQILAQLGCTDRFDRLEQEVERIGAGHGVCLAPLTRWFQGQVAAGQMVWEVGADGEGFQPLSEDVPVATLNLETLESAAFEETQPVVPRESGRANAVRLTFRLELQPGVELSTRGRDHGLHWSSPVHMLRAPAHLAAGRSVHLTLSYETGAEMAVRLSSE